jgi:hypothetical protein
MRALTSHWRPLPDALIIGGQRCGTSSLYKYLESHPDVSASLQKETRFFSQKFTEGEEWYRAQFPLAMGHGGGRVDRRQVCFEATPQYMLDPRAAGRAARLVPNARIIALLRNPVDRAISQYVHNLSLGLEPLEFEVALALESDRIAPDLTRMQRDGNLPLTPAVARYSYVERGLYAKQLRRWLEWFPLEQILLIRSEDFYADTATVFAQVLQFLRLPDWRPSEFHNFSAARRTGWRFAPAESIRRELSARFAGPNDDLCRLTGRDFGW